MNRLQQLKREVELIENQSQKALGNDLAILGLSTDCQTEMAIRTRSEHTKKSERVNW